MRISFFICATPLERYLRTYTETILKARDYLQRVVLWSDPGYPAEERQRLKEIVREPKVDKHSPKRPKEEFVSGHAVKLLEGTGHCDVRLVVQSGV